MELAQGLLAARLTHALFLTRRSPVLLGTVLYSGLKICISQSSLQIEVDKWYNLGQWCKNGSLRLKLLGLLLKSEWSGAHDWCAFSARWIFPFSSMEHEKHSRWGPFILQRWRKAMKITGGSSQLNPQPCNSFFDEVSVAWDWLLMRITWGYYKKLKLGLS